MNIKSKVYKDSNECDVWDELSGESVSVSWDECIEDVFIITPSTNQQRIKMVENKSNGFISMVVFKDDKRWMDWIEKNGENYNELKIIREMC